MLARGRAGDRSSRWRGRLHHQLRWCRAADSRPREPDRLCEVSSGIGRRAGPNDRADGAAKRAFDHLCWYERGPRVVGHELTVSSAEELRCFWRRYRPERL